MSSVPVLDPYTGEPMKKCGTCRRIVRTPYGVFYVWIEVYVDSQGHYHRALPDFLIPYKHFSVQTIEAALDHDQDLDLYDNPCDTTMKRWNTWMENILTGRLLRPGPSDSRPDALLRKFKTEYRRPSHKSSDYWFRKDGWLTHFFYQIFQTTLLCPI